MGFHLSPANLKFDEYSGDWGIGFFAAVRHASGFLVDDPELGMLCFLCDIIDSDDDTDDATSTKEAESGGSSMAVSDFAAVTRVKLKDAFRKKLFIASLGVELISEAGRLASVSISATKLTVTFEALHSQPAVSVLRLRVEQTATASGNRPALTIAPTATPAPVMVRGAWEFQPQGALQTTVVELAVAEA